MFKEHVCQFGEKFQASIKLILQHAEGERERGDNSIILIEKFGLEKIFDKNKNIRSLKLETVEVWKICFGLFATTLFIFIVKENRIFKI